MAFFTSDSICPADLYQFSDQRGGVDSYNIKQLSPVTPEKESLLDSRQRGNGADISTQRGPSANLRSASHKPKKPKKPKKRLTKNVAYKKPPSSETLKQPRQNHNLVEKRYRSRLKNHCFSRAEVLVSARDRIVSPEEGFEAMAKERDQLLTDIVLMYEFRY